MVYLNIAAMLVLVLLPVIIPAVFTGVHAVLRRRADRPVRIVGHPDRVAPPRLGLADPAAA